MPASTSSPTDHGLKNVLIEGLYQYARVPHSRPSFGLEWGFQRVPQVSRRSRPGFTGAGVRVSRDSRPGFVRTKLDPVRVSQVSRRSRPGSVIERSVILSGARRSRAQSKDPYNRHAAGAPGLARFETGRIIPCYWPLTTDYWPLATGYRRCSKLPPIPAVRESPMNIPRAPQPALSLPKGSPFGWANVGSLLAIASSSPPSLPPSRPGGSKAPTTAPASSVRTSPALSAAASMVPTSRSTAAPWAPIPLPA